jgi:molybdopterin molybdotransferase
MKDFFDVTELGRVLEMRDRFAVVGTEPVSLSDAFDRVLAADLTSDADLPDFMRSTMDGYAVRAASSFGASEANPAYLSVTGTVAMGEVPALSIGPGEAARIPTGGMLPEGADSVVMIEHTEAIDETTIEVYRSVAPGTHVIEKGEDFTEGEMILSTGRRLRSQEIGLLAAFGRTEVRVFKRPVIGIISTGDEVVPVDRAPRVGQIRDINTYTLSGLVRSCGGKPKAYGIVADDYDTLLSTCREAISASDMVLVSGGSSVGARDFTIEVLSNLTGSEILVHGISISPGKPTILARVAEKAFWGLPGHVVSAMVVFSAVVRPFIETIAGEGTDPSKRFHVPARLGRNLSSAQGRVDFVRVRLREIAGELWAEPVLGKSGLINTMVRADGLIEVGMNVEGLEKGNRVDVLPI